MSAPTQAEMAAWPAPNYVNPPTLKTATIAVVTIATATMLPVVVSRLYFRMRLKGRLGIDDFLITIAASGDAGVVLFAVCVTLPKISVCFTYLDLFQSRKNTAFCWTMIVALNCWWICTVLVTIFQCTPTAAYWDMNVHADYCINSGLFNIITGVINTVSDFLVYLWPIQFLWHIRLPAKQKFGVMLMFAIGCGACVAGILRIYTIHVIFAGYDLFYYSAMLWMLSTAETNVSIIFTCMHSCRPILSRMLPEFFGEVNRASSKNEKMASVKLSFA